MPLSPPPTTQFSEFSEFSEISCVSGNMPKMKVPSVTLPKKRNGLQSASKSFVEVFGDSSDDVGHFFNAFIAGFRVQYCTWQEKVLLGFSLPETWEEYRILAESCDAITPGKQVEVEATSQRPKRSCRMRGEVFCWAIIRMK